MAIDVGSESGARRKARPEMNVTPLVDVVLVVLIIFMVVMPAMQRYFRVHVPRPAQSEAAPPANQAPLVVSVAEGGALRINRETVADAEFAMRLRRMLVTRGDRKVYFDAADNAPFERAVTAMDLARGAGAAHIAVLTTHLE